MSTYREPLPVVEEILRSLEGIPLILDDFLAHVPADVIATRPSPDRWSIHEHVCHLGEVEPMFVGRAQQFIDEERPSFTPYDPDEATPGNRLADLVLEDAVAKMAENRARFVHTLRSLVEEDWEREADHPEYKVYTPLTLARHALFHDHFHLYRAEEIAFAP